MRIRNLKTYHLKHTEIIPDTKEGGRKTAFSPLAIPIEANIYDDDQKMIPGMQGISVPAQKIMLMGAPGMIRCEMDADTGQEKYRFGLDTPEYITIGDGLCVYASAEDTPDYRVVGISLCGGHLECRLERINGRIGQLA